MRILYLTSTAAFSGGEKVTLDIALYMRNSGHEVVYCGLEGDNRRVVERMGVSFYCLTEFSLKEVKRVVGEYQPNITHCMDFRASTYAALTGTRIVAHLHNNAPWLRRLGMNSLAMLFFCCRAKWIIAVSRSIMDEYVFGRLFKKKATVLYNAVDLNEILRKAGRNTNAPTIQQYEVGFIGRLTEPKQPLRFVSIVRALHLLLPNLRVVIIGSGDLEQLVKQTIKLYRLDDCITMRGFLWNPFPAIDQCHIVIMPSAWEGFGLTAVESMTLGKPVLASPVGGLREVINDTCGKLCASDDDFVREAYNLLTNSDEWQAKSDGARERAAVFQKDENYYEKIVRIYDYSCHVKRNADDRSK